MVGSWFFSCQYRCTCGRCSLRVCVVVSVCVRVCCRCPKARAGQDAHGPPLRVRGSGAPRFDGATTMEYEWHGDGGRDCVSLPVSVSKSVSVHVFVHVSVRVSVVQCRQKIAHRCADTVCVSCVGRQVVSTLLWYLSSSSLHDCHSQ